MNHGWPRSEQGDDAPPTPPARTSDRRLLGGRPARILLPVAALLVLASAALAYWTKSGSGSGSGAAGTSQAMAVSPGTPNAALYPGGQTDVALSISNPNPFPAHVGSLALDTTRGTAGLGVDAGHSGCDVSVLGFTTQTNGGSGWTVPPKVGATNGTLPVDMLGSLVMSAGAAGACQSANFTVYLTAGP
jgi:hypothetical protein